MGVAEITPGISGATIAGIFNVYEPFIKVLSLFNPKKLISQIIILPLFFLQYHQQRRGCDS